MKEDEKLKRTLPYQYVFMYYQIKAAKNIYITGVDVTEFFAFQ